MATSYAKLMTDFLDGVDGCFFGKNSSYWLEEANHCLLGMTTSVCLSRAVADCWAGAMATCSAREIVSC